MSVTVICIIFIEAKVSFQMKLVNFSITSASSLPTLAICLAPSTIPLVIHSCIIASAFLFIASKIASLAKVFNVFSSSVDSFLPSILALISLPNSVVLALPVKYSFIKLRKLNFLPFLSKFLMNSGSPPLKPLISTVWILLNSWSNIIFKPSVIVSL